HVYPFTLNFGEIEIAVKSSASGKKKGKLPSFNFFIKPVPLNFSAHIDGRVTAKLGVFGTVDGDAKVDISSQGIYIRFVSKVEFLGYDSDLEISFKFDKKGNINPKTLYVKAKLKTQGLGQLSNNLAKIEKELLIKAQKDLQEAKREALKAIENSIGDLKEGTQQRIKALQKEIKDWTNHCNKTFPGFWGTAPRLTCLAINVAPRQAALQALQFHKDVTLEVAEVAGTLSTRVAIEQSKAMASLLGEYAKAAAEITTFINKLTK
ncbi:unnamed protein product, partial [marine sediment metagenome]